MNTTNLTRKYVLSVGDCGGSLFEIAPQLKALGLEVVQASTIHKALALANRFSLLSLVVIEERAGARMGPALVTAIKDRNSDLPIIWIAQENSETQFDDASPDLVLTEPATASVLQEKTNELLCQHFYPDTLVERLTDSVARVLEDTFQSSAICNDRIIRANRSVLAEVNALITFVGKQIAGRMIVSGGLDEFREMFQRIAGTDTRTTRDDAADAAGEICNQALGNFKPFLESHGQAFALTPPILISGKDVDMRFKASRPALVLRFDRLFVEFCFDTFDPSLIESPPQLDEGLDSGDLTFF